MRGTDRDMARHRAETYSQLVKQNVESALREAGMDSQMRECPTLTGIVRVAKGLGVDPLGFFPSPGEVDSARSAARSQGHCPTAR